MDGVSKVLSVRVTGTKARVSMICSQFLITAAMSRKGKSRRGEDLRLTMISLHADARTWMKCLKASFINQ